LFARGKGEKSAVHPGEGKGEENTPAILSRGVRCLVTHLAALNRLQKGRKGRKDLYLILYKRERRFSSTSSRLARVDAHYILEGKGKKGGRRYYLSS